MSHVAERAGATPDLGAAIVLGSLGVDVREVGGLFADLTGWRGQGLSWNGLDRGVLCWGCGL